MSTLGASRVIAERLAALSPVVKSALERAAASLSEMTGVEITVSSTTLRLAAVTEVPHLAAGVEAVALGVYFAFLGEGHGHLLLLMDDQGAQQVAGLMLGEDPATVVVTDELPASALAEAGNVSCSAFLNVLGGAINMRLDITPPAVVKDMRGAILDALAVDIASVADEALVINARFAVRDQSLATQALDTRFLVVPAPETLHQLLVRGALAGAQN